MTIFAVSSGTGRAGVAVIRISGPETHRAVAALAGDLPPPRRATLRTLRDPVSRETLDQALVLSFPGPASFTGEDMAELHVHGGRAVIAGVLEALARIEGLRPAEAGEFARRAFENGKIDLTEAEGLADLIDAETEAQRVQALRQTAGALRKLYDGWRAELINAMALVEAALDFADEADVPEAAFAAARPAVEALHENISRHLSDERRGEILRDGLRVAIAGPPNAGKSSLLNALAGREAVIVSEEAGTTRDVIEVRLDLSGYPVILSDTAGIREAPGAIEQEGVRRAMRTAEDADLVLWLSDASLPPVAPPLEIARLEDRLITVANKIDLGAAPASAALAISAKTGAGLQELIGRLAKEAKARAGNEEAAVITRARHRHELERARLALGRFLDGGAAETELRAEDLREAAFALGRITGRVDVEQVLDQIFSQFCIGK